jgi:hypothetical protein
MSGSGAGVRFDPFPALEDLAQALDAPDRSAHLGKPITGDRAARLDLLNQQRAEAVYAAAATLGSMSAAYRDPSVTDYDRQIDALLAEGTGG